MANQRGRSHTPENGTSPVMESSAGERPVAVPHRLYAQSRRATRPGRMGSGGLS